MALLNRRRVLDGLLKLGSASLLPAAWAAQSAEVAGPLLLERMQWLNEPPSWRVDS